MLNSTVIKRLHCTLTGVLLLLVVSFAAYQYYFNGPRDDVFSSRQQVTATTFLYITRYNGGGATVSEVYRYYLDGNLPGDPMPHLNKRVPFLVAGVGDAKVTGYASHINVTLTGRVYSFTNSDLFYDGNTAVMPVISIMANGVR
ncbi:hypothetical protein [Cedecea davisae]|uniref:hypothetical protein n=1 Tax=Cedecea davisae TaxID=158484 RepID=UPI002432D354|nr:hypothetical protein [Cedecea davisae]